MKSHDMDVREAFGELVWGNRDFAEKRVSSCIKTKKGGINWENFA